MPSEKTRSKEDTWTPEELEKSLKDIRGDKRKPRDRDEKREHRRKDEDRERRHRNQDNGEGQKERHTKDDVRKSGGDRRSNHSLDKELDEIKKEERRIKDADREERHRRKKEERKTREDRDPKSRRGERDINDENNHNGRDEEGRVDRHRDKTEEREKRHRDREHSNRNEESDKPRRFGSEDRRKERDRDDSDRRRSHKDGEERRRSHKDDDDRRRSHKDDDDRHRSHKNDDDRRKSHKDEDRRRSHRDEEKRGSHKDSDERRRSHKDGDERRRSHKDGDERRRSHKDGDDRHKESDRETRHSRDRERARDKRDHKDEGSKERRSNKDSDDQNSRRKHRDRKTEEKAEGEKDERRQRSEDMRKGTDQVRFEEESESDKAEPPEATDTGTDNYEDDFEEYEEDFEEDAEESDNDKLPVESQVSSKADKAQIPYSDLSDLSVKHDWNAHTAPQNEVDDVLRALDAENERLMAESRRSFASDSTELSDERFRSSQTPNKQRTFINFVSAKQMVLSDKASSKTRTRGRDLLQLIDLDVASYDMFDLPPVKEYDLYIRNYGRTDTTQVYVQTNDDNIDRDIQTDEIESQEKWSQHPSEEAAASGSGNGAKDEEDMTSFHHIQTEDLSKLSKFIHKAGQIISILLEEESGDGESEMTSQSNISVSQGFSQLTAPPFLHGRTVYQTSFSPSNPNLLLTLYSYNEGTSVSNDVFSNLGIIFVWNISEPSVPQKILVCDSMPSCCCFSPSITSLIFAGMHDGSLVLWDTREPSSLHQTIEREGREFCLRYPTYNTAGVLGDDNHQCSVVTVTATLPPVQSSSSSTSLLEESRGASYQIVSVDEAGCINLWVVAEIASPDLAGSESDLGLSPGGKVKLLRSSSFTLEHPLKDARLHTGLKVTCLQLSPGDSNIFIVGTDRGFIIHSARFGAKPIPRVYLGLTESPLDVTCVDYSPFGNPCFLAGCADGIVRLYHSSNAKPLMVWPPRDANTSVISVQWSTSRPGVFFILYDNSTLAVYDLVETDSRPSALDQIQSGRALDMRLSPDVYCRGKGQPNKRPHMVLQLDNGKSEIHTITKTLVEQQPFEEDFLNSYLDRF